MKCHEARQHWMLYLDSEGDPEMHLRINDHLGMCPECAEWFARQMRFEQAIEERLADGQPTPELWDRILARSGITTRASPRRRWLVLGGIAVAAAVLLGLASLFLLWQPRASAELPRLTVDCHERHLRGVSQVEFRSQDDQAIERYIREQVPFSVHCPPRKDVDFAVEGAGVCRWAPKPMVYFVGRVDQTSVSVFVLDRASLDLLAQGGGRYRSQEGGYQTVSGLTADNVVVVVGTVPSEVLEKLLNAYGSYHGG
jgi:anti-sigma factor RsiW